MQLKVLPSSSITVDQNATLIIGEKAKVSVYDTFTAYDSLENAYFNSSFVGIDAAQMTVNGNLVVNGALGGKVDSTSQGKVTVGSAASLSVQFPEGAKLGSTASFQNLTQPALNLSLPGIATVEKSNTYNYNSIDNVWIKG